MKYLGGKQLIGKQISDYIKNDTQYKTYFEPFCGALGVGRHNHYEDYIFNDIHPDLILFLKKLYAGTFIYPESVSEEEYKTLKSAPSSPLRGFVGFFLSYGGKWFGGFSKKYSNKRDYLKEATKSCEKLYSDLKTKPIFFCNKNYDEFTPLGMTIYCDIPYENTTEYGVKIDHELFWNVMKKWSGNNDVYVSSYDAPFEWECVWECKKRVTIGNEKTVSKYERLFKLKNI